MKNKEILFSVTANDCDWEYLRGTGPGGQKRNKTETKVRCIHRASGATGESDLTRSQHENKRIAFKKMAESSLFKKWHKIETAKRMGSYISSEEYIKEQMQDKYLKIEGKVVGKWVPIDQAIFKEEI